MAQTTTLAAVALGLVLAIGLPASPTEDAGAERAAQARYNDLLAQGAAAFARGAYQTAAVRFEEALRLLPASPTAYMEAGQACIAWGEFDRAGEHLRAGMRRRPSWPRMPDGLARLQRRPGLLSRRTAELDRELARAASLDRLFVQGALAYFQGDRVVARQHFGQAQQVAPGDLPTKLFLAALEREALRPAARGAPAGAAAAEADGWMGP